MSSLNFVLPSPLTTTVLAAPKLSSSCSKFAARVPLSVSASARRVAVIRMSSDSGRSDGYVIRESNYRDPDETSDDDSGDGFMGEAEMDDILGVSMPDDLASFERREIQNTQTREELVEKLKEIKHRRRDIMVDRRRGIGMDNVNNYLNNL